MVRAAATGRARSVVRVRMYRTVTVGMAGLCRFSEGFWSQAGRLLKKTGIRTGWRHETERRRVATRPEWVAGRLIRGETKGEPLCSDGGPPAS